MIINCVITLIGCLTWALMAMWQWLVSACLINNSNGDEVTFVILWKKKKKLEKKGTNLPVVAGEIAQSFDIAGSHQ